ncbi:OLC1v1012254C1 [Oldenlandia corymbosa var. corymbosa]|uniref:OLC1v1012254C1 n=1 Tax=Oldenlandia corymbosa var. corymbosa TaxID=529605 RepID=A0AAV1DVK4_OLDCO|nr:OLC1v1012254C1 [Oldenlandia corymbosa var. corymbosa]
MRFAKKVRRLVFHGFKSDTEVNAMCFKYLRSLIFIRSLEPLSKSQLSHMLCAGSKLLKLLDLEGTALEEIPEQVFKLFHLRTLNLKCTRLKMISKCIGCLKNLEFLDVSYTKVSKLPEEILKLKGLIHLNVFQCNPSTRFTFKEFKGPNNISKLSSLERLLCVGANETVIKEIGMLKKLKVLAITILRRGDEQHLWLSLGNLTHLRELHLQAANDDEVIDLNDTNITFGSSFRNLQVVFLKGRLERLPKLVSCLQGLISVSLVLSKLMDDPLESLQYLQNLRALLLDQAFQGEHLCFKFGFFLKLERLTLVSLHNLGWLRVEEGAMPNLGMLGIISLPSLQEFPWGVQHLTKLQHLYLELMSDEVTIELQNQDENCENYQKISHILQILIWDHEDGWCRHPQYWKTRKPRMNSRGNP